MFFCYFNGNWLIDYLMSSEKYLMQSYREINGIYHKKRTNIISAFIVFQNMVIHLIRIRKSKKNRQHNVNLFSMVI
jgi:hypothetical protein